MKLNQMSAKVPPPKILIWSPSGSGKTALAATYGDGLYVIDIDDSLLTCFRLQDSFTKDRLAIEPYDAVERDTRTATSFIKTKQKLIAINNAVASGSWNGSDGRKLTGLLVDGLSFLCDACLRYVLYNSGKLGKELARSSDPKELLKNNSSQAEWGLMINEMEQIMQLIRGLPIPVILTAHAITVTDAAGMTKYEIAIPTKHLPPRIPGFFDEVWFLDTQFAAAGKIERVLRTSVSPVFASNKTRGQLPDGTNCNVGMRNLISKLGYDVPIVPPSPPVSVAIPSKA